MVTTVQNTIEREVVYPQPIERVWAAITEPQLMRHWFCSQGAEIDMRPGGAMLLKWNHGTSRAIVETVDPPRRFSFRWYPGSGEDPARPLEEQGPLTLVAFSLEPVAEGTRLRLVESGFASLSEQRRATAFGENDDGWDECLAELEALLRSEDDR